jgi:ribulose-5-phosphate 4-epimerase/fuculose-1-phosphate aldolase
LLQNHGILAFGEDLAAATTIALILEEAAHVALLAETLGGATVIPQEQAAHALRRATEFVGFETPALAGQRTVAEWDWVVR